MGDLQLIYDACLRAERKLEKRDRMRDPLTPHLDAMIGAIQAIREEIGNGLAALPTPPKGQEP